MGSLLSTSPVVAQDAEDTRPSSDFKRLGGETVENEPVLDLSLPEPEVKPETPEQREARREQERQALITRTLEDARSAMRAGRIDQPQEISAWTYFSEVLRLDPGNVTALDGLAAVQRAMVNRAVGYARELDFETADRLLDDAAFVRAEQGPVVDARKEIAAFRSSYAAELEVEAVTAMDAGRFDQAERALIGLVALGGADAQVNQLRRRLEESKVYGGLEPGQVIRDHFVDSRVWTPESVIIEAGSFMMGSTVSEDGRRDHEGPQHRVTFSRGFAIGRSEVTVAQFRAFVDGAAYRTDAEKLGHSMIYDPNSGRLVQRDRADWEHDYEGRRASEDLPVVHVSFNDAQAYVKWLSRGTGKPYRLPTEAEFEYALRAGRIGPYWWGDGPPSEVVENLTGERDVSRNRRKWETFFEDYGDRHWGPAPVASFKANPFGLFDAGGNVAEWVMDCWHDSYIRAPDDGSAWINPGCKTRVVRGAYWASAPQQARSAYRLQAQPTLRDGRVGFRIARDL
ncbi:MAG: formylglycine-generating enzyme family protein [Gammaproteobacteria bacterium]|nr:formylglycine-generating enzyme family protein [Gammaproteobacteria bacterium]